MLFIFKGFTENTIRLHYKKAKPVKRNPKNSIGKTLLYFLFYNKPV